MNAQKIIDDLTKELEEAKHQWSKGIHKNTALAQLYELSVNARNELLKARHAKDEGLEAFLDRSTFSICKS